MRCYTEWPLPTKNLFNSPEVENDLHQLSDIHLSILLYFQILTRMRFRQIITRA